MKIFNEGLIRVIAIGSTVYLIKEGWTILPVALLALVICMGIDALVIILDHYYANPKDKETESFETCIWYRAVGSNCIYRLECSNTFIMYGPRSAGKCDHCSKRVVFRD